MNCYPMRGTLAVLLCCLVLCAPAYAGLDSLLKSAQDIGQGSGAIVEMLFLAAAWYLILTSVFSVGQYYLERRYARGSMRTLPLTPLQRLRKNLQLFGSFRRPEVTR